MKYSTDPPSSGPIKLSLHGLNVVSFKNSKMIARGRLITDPKKQKQMEQIIQSFASQLTSWFRTTGIETGTGCSALSQIALYLPLDDSLKWIAEHSVKSRQVSKGNEGAVITIERIA